MKEKITSEWWGIDAKEGYQEWYESIHKFCSVCASINELFIEKRGYSTQTGNQLYLVYKICPKKRWWNWHDHDNNVLPPPPKFLE